MSISRISERAKIGLAEAVKQIDIEVIEYLLKAGLKPNGTVKIEYGDIFSYLGMAAMKHNYQMAELLYKFGGDVIEAINVNYNHFVSMRGIRSKLLKATETYRLALQLLFDFAVGLDFTSKLTQYGDPIHRVRLTNSYAILKFLQNIDISGFNFIGVSIDGYPVTKEILIQHQFKGVEKAITTLIDLEKLEDLNRKSIIKNNLSSVFAKRGEIIEEKTKVVNLIPIGESVKRNDIDTVKLRLSKGESPSSLHDNISLISWAAAFGYDEMVILLLTYPNFDKSQIPHAIQLAKLNHRDAILDSLKSEQDYNQIDKHGNTLLHIAAEKGNVATVKECIEHKADLNILNNKGETALHIASGKTRGRRISYQQKLEQYDLEIIQLLLEAKADANIGKYSTALNLAAKSGSYEAVKMLLPKTTKKDHHYEDCLDDKWIKKSEPWFVPLMFDSFGSKKWLDILTILKENEADLNYQDHEHGYSLLMKVMLHISSEKINNKAKFMYYEKQINFLLDNGVKIDVKNKYGQTVFDFLIDRLGSNESMEYKKVEKLLKRQPIKEQLLSSNLQLQSFLKNSPPLNHNKIINSRENKETLRR